MNVTIWNEYHPSQRTGKAAKTYPDGIHKAIAAIFESDENVSIKFATQEDPENGLTDKILADTDVLIWWGDRWQENVLESVKEKVLLRVQNGMGFIALHGACRSKIFTSLIGTSGAHGSANDGKAERLYAVCPSHPILDGVSESFSLSQEETYSEYFDVPAPDELLLLGGFQGGSAFRSAMTYRRGRGKIFYFQPGHEEYPTYYDLNIKKIISNAAYWACPTGSVKEKSAPTVSRESGIRRFFKWK